MNEQEHSRNFLDAIRKRDHELAAVSMAGMLNETRSAGHDALVQVFFVLLASSHKHGQLHALSWVRTLPGSSTVLLDLSQGIDRVEKGGVL